MKILVVGGGSGGHVTPAIVALREIAKLRPRAELEFWVDKKYYENVVKVTTSDGLKVRVRKITVGKFRRYSNVRWWEFIVKPEMWKDLFANTIDIFKISWALFVSFWRLIFRRPDVVFLKGGYTSLAVGLACRVLRISYVIHDSDSVFGLTTRVLASRAQKILTGMPFDGSVKYADKMEWVGTPIGEQFQPVSKTKQRELKKKLEFSGERPMVLFTGGSQGSMHINEAVGKVLPELEKMADVVLVAGRQGYGEMLDLKSREVWEDGKLKSGFRMFEFLTSLSEVSGAADVVVSRAGATTIMELAALKKAVILVPYGVLPNEHQSKNAEELAKSGAVLMIDDSELVENPGKMFKMVKKLLGSESMREEMGEELNKIVKPDAGARLAEIIVNVGQK